MKRKVKWAIIAGIGCLLAQAPQVKANTILTVGDGYTVGTINPGVDFGDGDIPGYINQLVGMGLNTTYGPVDYANHQNTWYRSGNSFGPLATVDPNTWESLSGSFGGSTTSFSPGSGEMYLVAKYDGPNGGLAVWDVNGLTGVDIPSNAFGNYGLSGSWLVYASGPPPPDVPDGGTTALLLGAALSALGLVRWKLS